MRDTVLEFDSDELDDLSIDWEDILAVRSPLSHTYVFERAREKSSATGPSQIDKQTVRVNVGSEIKEGERSELVAILRGSSRRDYWSGSLTLGLTLRTGNTDQLGNRGLQQVG